MATQGLIRIGLILASSVPSLFCFGLAGYLMGEHISEGWGWLLFVGLLGLEVPKRVLQLPEFNQPSATWSIHRKPEPVYQEFN